MVSLIETYKNILPPSASYLVYAESTLTAVSIFSFYWLQESVVDVTSSGKLVALGQ